MTLYATELDGPRSDITALLDTVAAVERTGDTYPCRLRDDGVTGIQGMPAWFRVRRVRIKFPWDADVQINDLLDVDDLGQWTVTELNEPQSDSLSLRALGVPGGEDAVTPFQQSGMTVTFEDTSSGEKIENAPVLIYPASQSVEITPEAVNFDYAISWSAVLAYPTRGAPDVADRVTGFYRMPNGAYLTKPYPTLNPDLPMLLAFLRETM